MAEGQVKSRFAYERLGLWLFAERKTLFPSTRPQGIGSEWSSLIIRFDTKTEMFTEIATPSRDYFEGALSCVCFTKEVVTDSSCGKWTEMESGRRPYQVREHNNISSQRCGEILDTNSPSSWAISASNVGLSSVDPFSHIMQ
ncbi:hypothetical protein L6452_08721 [Arctium lappa]|uniref:Uncharacterized protein n=1 Tax=Arctium lappa TaxID=4217 RepID=A0ACB9DI16_ARCLA|nr:hypothetical protein L6452_08721 [Arctium lappa]